MKALRRPLPRKRLRTIASAHTIPNTVFTGTAMAVMIRVSLKALSVSGVESASHAGAKPSSNVLQKTIASGTDEDDREVEERDWRADRDASRDPSPVVPRRVVTDGADREQREKRDREEHDCDGCRSRESPLSMRP